MEFVDCIAGETVRISLLDKVMCKIGFHLCPSLLPPGPYPAVDKTCFICGKQLRTSAAYYVKEAR